MAGFDQIRSVSVCGCAYAPIGHLQRLERWRGRGVASAFKRASIAWAKANGFERLVTSNELRNEPIRRLNARLGYREVPGHVIVRGPLLVG